MEPLNIPLDVVKKEMAERSLHHFIRQAWEHIESAPFVDNWHIGAIAEHLQAVSAGQIKKLLINIPPGCSKSLTCCVMWPTWEWTRNAAIRWFFASYDQRLSTRDSVKCRTLLNTSWYKSRWGDRFRLVEDQNQKTYFETSRGGYRMATTPSSHGMGEHPDRKVYDDIQDIAGAESDAEIQTLFEWYDLTMPSRGVSRNCAEVTIMQRLKENDFTAHILEQGGWEWIRLPMRFDKTYVLPATQLGFVDPRKEEGELLTPNQFDEVKVADLEKRLRVYGTAGQLQQRPVPRSGGMFHRDWFKIVDAAPVQAARVRGWDKAATAGAGDFSAGVLIAKTDSGLYFIEDVVKGQWSSGERERIIEQTAELDALKHPDVEIWMEQEPGSAGKDSVGASIRMLARFPVYAEKPTGDKFVRAKPLAAQAEAGNVYIMRGQWNSEFLDEICVAPKGKHDDQLDGASLAFNKLALKMSTLTYGAGDDTLLDDLPKDLRPDSTSLAERIANMDGRDDYSVGRYDG